MQMLQQYLLAAQDGRMLFQLPAIGGNLASVVTILAADCTLQETNGSIAVSKDRYYHVYAVPVQVKEGAVGIAMLCECSSMEAAWRTVRGHDLTGCSLEELSDVLCPCIHAQAAQEQYEQQLAVWLDMLDSRQLYRVLKAAEIVCPAVQAEGEEQEQQEEQQVRGVRQQQQVSRQAVFVLDEETLLLSYVMNGRRYAANITEQGFLHCCSCPHDNALSCVHVKALREYMRTDLMAQEVFEGAKLAAEAQGQPQQPESAPSRSSVSQYSIPMSPHDMFKARGLTGFAANMCSHCREHAPRVEDGGIGAVAAFSCHHLVPPVPDLPCECGSCWSNADPVEMKWVQEDKGVLLAPTTARQVQVYYRQCSSCLLHCLYIRCTRCKRLLYTGEQHAVFNHSHKYLMCHEVGLHFWSLFTRQRLTFRGHYEQLKVYYELSGSEELLPSRNTHRVMLLNFLNCLEVPYEQLFCCPICQDTPEVVICDCKEMGIQRVHARPCDRPVDPELTAAEAVVFADAVPIGYPKVRSGLWKWANGADLTEAEAEDLAVAAEKYEKEVYQVLTYMAGREQPVRDWCKADRGVYSGFFKRVSISYPAASVVNITEASTSMLHGILQGQQVTLALRQMLEETFPALHILCAEAGLSEVPESFRPLLQRIVQKATALRECQDVFGDVTDPAIEDSHVYMPSFPLQRLLARYPTLENKRAKEGNTCGKSSGSHNIFTPGVCLCFCGHSVCLGFKLLVRSEGPSTIFELVATRFKMAPRWIIYDNACNAHNFCIKRLPRFFSNTRFFVDRLHWFNHSGCGRGYCLNDLKQDIQVAPGVTLKELNTQICEQCNSRLENIRTQVAYAKHDNAMAFLKFFLAMTNKKIIDDLQSNSRGPLQQG